VTRHKVSITNFLPQSYWEKILKVPGVVAVCPTSWFGGIYVEERNFFPQFAVDPRSFLALNVGEKRFRLGPEQAEEWARDRQGVMVHEDLAGKYGWKIGDRFTLRGTIYPFSPELRVRAIYSGEDSAVYFHHDYLDEGIGRRGIVGTYWIKVDGTESLSRVAKAIDARFANSDAETLTETEQAFSAHFVEMFGDVKSLVRNLSLVICVTILVVAANTMSMAIRERTTEIAVMKALGFPPGRLFLLLLGEAAVLCGIGGLAGVLSFWGITHWIFNVARYRIPMLWFTLVPPAWMVGLLWLGSLLLGVASGLVPAASAVRRKIVDGLRQA